MSRMLGFESEMLRSGSAHVARFITIQKNLNLS